MHNERLYQLIQEKMKQLNRYLIRLGANQNDAEDIVQETVYKGMLYIDSIDPEKFSGWLYKVALNNDKIPEPADLVYGFGPGIDNHKVTENNFLSSIEDGLNLKGKYYNEYKRIFDNLRSHKKKPAKSDVKIIGVVVTGTPETLKALKEQKYIKATTLGAVTNKY